MPPRKRRDSARQAAKPKAPAARRAGTEQQRKAAARASRNWVWGLVIASAVVLCTTLLLARPEGTTVPVPMRVRVVRAYPHDPNAFTQGLLFHRGRVYESTGLNGESSVREVDLTSGRVLRRVDVASEYFGEGLASVGDRLVQLTWKSGRALVWKLSTFEQSRSFSYDGEGWGLCYDGKRLVMSDGSARLTFRDPNTFRAIGDVEVTEAGRPLRLLNELECVGSDVYANVWQSDRIVRIDGATGEVTATIDASGLLDAAESEGVDVLNGIAWVPSRRRFLVTGKLWPKMFEVEFVRTGE